MEGVAVDVSGDDGWCERLWTIADFAARKFDIFPFALEPLNSASSLIYSVLGLSGLIALEDPFYRVCISADWRGGRAVAQRVDARRDVGHQPARRIVGRRDERRREGGGDECEGEQPHFTTTTKRKEKRRDGRMHN